MIPRVARGSTSFSEAQNYYLHDKDTALLDREAEQSPMEKAGDYALHDKGRKRTSYRVGFTETMNLEATDPHEAIREMRDRYEAFRANEHHKRGRKLQKPVYTYSLSWSPEESPSREDMLAAARSSLKAMRLEGLQTLIVQHLDEPHPHIHLIVHRIEADGRRARNIPWDHLRFSRWAEAYEKEHGKVLCTQREKNNARRAEGQFVRDEVSLPRKDYEDHPFYLRVTPDPRIVPEAEERTRRMFERHVEERRDLEIRVNEHRWANFKYVSVIMWRRMKFTLRRKMFMDRKLREANRGGILDRAVLAYRMREYLELAGPLGKDEFFKICLSPRKFAARIEKAFRQDMIDVERAKRGYHEKAEQMGQQAWLLGHRELVARQRFERDLLVAQIVGESSARTRSPVVEQRDLRPEPQPVVPELRQGEQLTPEAANDILHDRDPLRDEFAKSAAPRKGRRRGRDDDFEQGL